MPRSYRNDLNGGAAKPPSFFHSDTPLDPSLLRIKNKAHRYLHDLGLSPDIKEALFSGKMIRSHLCLSAGAALQAPDALVQAIACGVEMVHEASLCHDDIQDGQIERRRKPTLWKAMGVNQAINFGDLLTALSYRPLLELKAYNSHLLVNHLNQVIAEVIRGQILEQQNLGRVVSRSFYERVAALKTGALIAAGPQLICLGMGQTLAMQSVTTAFQHLSLAFQILNDLSSTSEEGLELDFKNRVFSFPFILLQERISQGKHKKCVFELCSSFQDANQLMLQFSIREEVLHLGAAHLRLFRERLRQLGDEWPAHFEPLLSRHFESSMTV